MRGTIYRSQGGFYTVKAGQELIQCKPRGLFRKTGERLVVGDRVVLAKEADTWYISELLERENRFVRPPVANVGQLFIVASTVEPAPSTLVLDKLTVISFEQEVTPVLVITKTDLRPAAFLQQAYAHSGIDVVLANAATGEGVGEIRERLSDRLSVFCGNSGVGKSTLLNAVVPELILATGEISQKLGRGRHTTREVELFEAGGGLVADTPGFASLDLQQIAAIPKENLQFDFPEIEQRMGECRFTGCSHLAEKGCAVLAAVENGEITPERYQSYVTLYTQAKEAEIY